MSTLDDLKKRFEEAVKYFNKFDTKNWSNLRALLDDDIRMKKLDDVGYHEGIAAVEKYFFGHGKDDEAVFTPDANRDYQILGNIGFVSGAANFVDKTKSNPTSSRRIVYSFAFTNSSGTWKEIHAWGKYII